MFEKLTSSHEIDKNQPTFGDLVGKVLEGEKPVIKGRKFLGFGTIIETTQIRLQNHEGVAEAFSRDNNVLFTYIHSEKHRPTRVDEYDSYSIELQSDQNPPSDELTPLDYATRPSLNDPVDPDNLVVRLLQAHIDPATKTT